MRNLVETAEILLVSEADVFRLAHRYWYERDLSESQLDTHFGDYLNRGELPQWLRDFCHRVLDRADAGGLDRREFGVDRPRRVPFRNGQVGSFTTFAAFVVFWWLMG